ncbi:kinase-like domain-containing protein, partial [Mycena filopes]
MHAGVKITSPYARRSIIWSFGVARGILAYGCKLFLRSVWFGGCIFVSRCLPWLARSILKTALWVKERLDRYIPTGKARQSTKRTFPLVPVPPPPLTVAPPRWTRWVEITVDGVVRAQIHPKNILAKELLGRGAFGTVSNAVNLDTGKALAIKRVSKASMGQEGEHLVLAEARAMSRASKAQGPYPTLHGFFIDEVDYIFVMDHLPGGTLYHRIGTQGVSRPEALLYAAQLFVAIKGIHSLGIIHRDIKPDNIFLDCHGKLVLGDFGLAKLFDMNVQCGPAWNAAKEAGGDHFPIILPHGNPHTDTARRGTDVYGAPEARSGEKYSYGVDYYSFAVCFFEMITGLWPY